MSDLASDIQLAELFSKSVIDAGKLYRELDAESKKVLAEAFAEALFYMGESKLESRIRSILYEQ
jgi:hypothetical protein